MNAFPIVCIGGTATVGSGCWSAGATMKFTFSGTSWLMHSNIASNVSNLITYADGTVSYNKTQVDTNLNSALDNYQPKGNYLKYVYKAQANTHSFTMESPKSYLVFLTQARTATNYPLAKVSIVQWGGTDGGFKQTVLYANTTYTGNITNTDNVLNANCNGVGCILRIIEIW